MKQLIKKIKFRKKTTIDAPTGPCIYDTQEFIAKITEILERFEGQGYKMTLRQLYYQLVAAAYIPNCLASYRVLGRLIANGRMAGLFDWDTIEDRMRKPGLWPSWDSMRQLLLEKVHLFRSDWWDEQDTYVEVAIEKDAIRGIVEEVTSRYCIPLSVNRGYSSTTALYHMAKRLEEQISKEKPCRVLYIGDHDPSGMQMLHDMNNRLTTFLEGFGYSEDFLYDALDVVRVCLNFDQVKRYNLPENPVKMTDRRAENYIEQFGESCWEVDAIPPDVLLDLLNDAVKCYCDTDAIEDAENRDAEKMGRAMALIERYIEI